MNKAEKTALEKYPAEKSVFDKCEKQRYAYICGYIQAEKDNELTWEDLKTLDYISDDVYAECDVGLFDEKEYYQEVLKRFLKLKVTNN